MKFVSFFFALSVKFVSFFRGFFLHKKLDHFHQGQYLSLPTLAERTFLRFSVKLVSFFFRAQCEVCEFFFAVFFLYKKT